MCYLHFGPFGLDFSAPILDFFPFKDPLKYIGTDRHRHINQHRTDTVVFGVYREKFHDSFIESIIFIIKIPFFLSILIRIEKRIKELLLGNALFVAI